MTAIQPAGYVVTDNELIHGIGTTADAAWDDAIRNLREAGIKVVERTPEDSDGGNWTLNSGLHIRSASAGLLAEVKAIGGDKGWFNAGGVCCTREEAGG